MHQSGIEPEQQSSCPDEECRTVYAQEERSFWDNLGRHLPSFHQGVVDAAAGFGDGVSFGLTKRARRALNINSGVNEESSAYRVSEVAGNLTIAATGSGLVLTGTRSSVLAATASASNIYFNDASSGSLILDAVNIGAGFVFGNTPAGRVGAAIVNFQSTNSSFLVSD
ncbi:hypothetical protein [Teredinibacter turnerae]|uniref:hypothetical protein n=1 Tax=Teredinibacter turnerae TaxID=2426 RepID=UPI001E2DB222|nr:hypothetical protein [Teredinibacter turnerae]